MAGVFASSFPQERKSLSLPARRVRDGEPGGNTLVSQGRIMENIHAYAIPGLREPVSSLSHLLGAAVFSVLAYFLVRRGRGRWNRTASLAIFALATLLTLSLSSVYHLLPSGTARRVLLRLDVASVFVLIAGTFTPIHLILFTGRSRWLPLLLMWCAATAGLTLRIVFFEHLSSGVGTLLFLLMGWGGGLTGVVLLRRYGLAFILPLVWGGLSYTPGAVALGFPGLVLIPGVVGRHEIWHATVLAGLGFHWQFAFRFAGGMPNHGKEQAISGSSLSSTAWD